MSGREPMLFTHVTPEELSWRQQGNPIADDRPTIEMTPITHNTIPGPSIARVDRGHERTTLVLATLAAIVTFVFVGSTIVKDAVIEPKVTSPIVISPDAVLPRVPVVPPVIAAPATTEQPVFVPRQQLTARDVSVNSPYTSSTTRARSRPRVAVVPRTTRVPSPATTTTGTAPMTESPVTRTPEPSEPPAPSTIAVPPPTTTAPPSKMTEPAEPPPSRIAEGTEPRSTIAQ